MEGIDPETGLRVSGEQQAAQRFKRAITTPLGTREKRRSVGSEVPMLRGLANETNRMLMINRIHRAHANPDNQLYDIQNPEVECVIVDAGFHVRVHYEYDGVTGSIEL